MSELLQAQNGRPVLRLIGPVGPGLGQISAASVQAALDELEGAEALDVILHGPGGSIHEGFFIYVSLRDFPAPVRIQIPAIAASIYSVIAMAAEPGAIEIADVARIMVHNPHMAILGEAEDLRKGADLLDQLKGDILTAYKRHSKLDRKQLAAAMNATTWYGAKDAVAAGLASKVKTGMPVPKKPVDWDEFASLTGGKAPEEIINSLDELWASPPAADPQRSAPGVACEVAAFLRDHPLGQMPPMAPQDFEAALAALSQPGQLPLEMNS